MNPCNCGNCRVCWLIAHRPEYAEKFEEASPTVVKPLLVSPPEEYDCDHFGERTGKYVKCIDGCTRPDARVPVFACSLFGEATKLLRGEGVERCCKHCDRCTSLYPPVKESAKMEWAYGVTTVPERMATYLPRTLKSLAEADFDSPRLFVDGASLSHLWEAKFGLPITTREPRIRTHGNWILGMLELYIRNPSADRYAMFQDDFVTVKRLKEYLEATTTQEKSFWNLLTFPDRWGQDLCREKGWCRSTQLGKGALATVFTNEGVRALLSAQHMVDRVQNRRIMPRNGWEDGQERIDGGIVDSMKKAGYTELIHSVSLVRHIGDESAMGHMRYPEDESFPGEETDIVEFMK